MEERVVVLGLVGGRRARRLVAKTALGAALLASPWTLYAWVPALSLAGVPLWLAVTLSVSSLAGLAILWASLARR